MNPPSRGTEAAPAHKDQMGKMIHDHAECIAFAEEMLQVAETGSDADLAALAVRVHRYNIDELEPHLQHEEQVVLRTLIQNHPEHMPLCVTVGREHGAIRTLVESLSMRTDRDRVAELGRLLKEHTLFEDRELFPLIDSLFDEAQLDAIASFKPLMRMEPPAPGPGTREVHEPPAWLATIGDLAGGAGKTGGSIVLFGRYDPEVIERMARHLGVELFDFQKEVMADFGPAAETISLEQLDDAIRDRSAKGSIVSHNVEALLCAKPEDQRQAWLSAFLEQDWPNPVFLPITVFQADVPREHARVCSLDGGRS